MPAHASRTLATAPSAPPSRACSLRHRPANAGTPAELSASPASRPLKLRSVDSGLDKLEPTESRLWTLGTRFREEADDPENPLVRAVSWALGYRLLESSEQEARATYGGPFAPMAEMRDPISIFPPYLLDLPNRDEVVAAWRDVADSVHSPVVAARLCDLVWCADTGSERYQHARRAIESYISVADSAETDGVYVTKHLDRALDLARQIKATDLVERARDRIMVALENELQREDASSRPGIWARLLNLLVSLDPEDRPSGLREQVLQAHDHAHERPDVRQALFELEEELVRDGPEEVERIQLATAEMLIEHALRQEHGLARAHWLREALTVANHKRGASGSREQILREIEQIDPDSYDLQQVAFESGVPVEDAEALVEDIVGDDGLGAALRRLAFSDGPPVGEPQDVERAVDALAQEFVFKNFFGRVVLDDNGYPIRHVETDEDKRKIDILDYDMLGITFDAALRQVALDRIGDRYSRDGDSLRAFFETDLIDADEADAFARALESYWADCPDEALHVALPRVEAVFRKWLGAAGGQMYLPPRGSTPGRARGLDSVLEGLSELHPDIERWWRFFRVALTIPSPGLNLRNRHLHGLAGAATKQDAAIVLRIAAALRSVGIKTETGGQTQTPTE